MVCYKAKTYGKVSLECLRSLVDEVATYFAVVADIQAVELIQPIRNGLEKN
jgi:hypothetical protein